MKSNWERTSVVKNIVGVIDQMAVRIVLNGWRFRCLHEHNSRGAVAVVWGGRAKRVFVQRHHHHHRQGVIVIVIIISSNGSGSHHHHHWHHDKWRGGRGREACSTFDQ